MKLYPIIVKYRYYAKHSGKPIDTENHFWSWKAALRFMKKVDSDRFNGIVTGWVCWDSYDNQMLSTRHVLKDLIEYEKEMMIDKEESK